LRVVDAVFELQRVLRGQIGEPFLEAILVEELLQTLASGQVKMVVALGADVEPGLGFL
jgi:hypothetical protein